MTHAPETEAASPVLVEFLATRDVPCPVCDYDLRGAESTRCPECGARLDLRVGSDDARLGPWVAVIVALCLPLGLLAVFSVLAAISAAIGDFTTPADWGAASVAWTGTASLAAAAIALVRRRRAFLRQSRGRQRATAIILAAFAVLVLVGFFLSFAGVV